MPKLNIDANGVAASGYDVVAYFTESSAVAGTGDHTVAHGGATYQFSSAANREEFERNTEKYLPAFGGYCPFGLVAMSQCAPTDPKTFRVQDGRLLLFFNDLWEGKPFDTSQKWDEDAAGMLQKADTAWPEVSAK